MSNQDEAEGDPNNQKPGPDPERLKIKGDWKDALRRTVPLKKPPEGWPDEGGDADDDKESGENAEKA